MRGRVYTGSARVAVRLAKIIDRPSNKRGRSLKQKRPTIRCIGKKGGRRFRLLLGSVGPMMIVHE